MTIEVGCNGATALFCLPLTQWKRTAIVLSCGKECGGACLGLRLGTGVRSERWRMGGGGSHTFSTWGEITEIKRSLYFLSEVCVCVCDGRGGGRGSIQTRL